MTLNEKYNLTIKECAKYFGIGENKIRQIVNNNPDANYILRVGNKTLIKRKRFEELIERIDCI